MKGGRERSVHVRSRSTQQPPHTAATHRGVEYGAEGTSFRSRWSLLRGRRLVSFNEECREGGTGAI